MDIAILVVLVSAFAFLVTTHLALSLALCIRLSWWRGLLALLVPPLAPYWGYESGFRVAAALWLIFVFVYSVTLIAALSL